MESAALGRPFTRDGWSSRFELVSRFDAADGAGASDDVVSAKTRQKISHDLLTLGWREALRSGIVCRCKCRVGYVAKLNLFVFCDLGSGSGQFDKGVSTQE